MSEPMLEICITHTDDLEAVAMLVVMARGLGMPENAPADASFGCIKFAWPLKELSEDETSVTSR